MKRAFLLKHSDIQHPSKFPEPELWKSLTWRFCFPWAAKDPIHWSISLNVWVHQEKYRHILLWLKYYLHLRQPFLRSKHEWDDGFLWRFFWQGCKIIVSSKIVFWDKNGRKTRFWLKQMYHPPYKAVDSCIQFKAWHNLPYQEPTALWVPYLRHWVMTIYAC